MLSNKSTAAEVEKMLRECSDILNESIRRVMETCPEEEFKAYRRIIGRIMADVYLDVLQAIHRAYPELEPEELKRKA
jgi:hypothetical protein